MANSDKNIRIQPNRNSTLFPKITFTGQSNNPITLNVLDDNSLSFEGSAGQLFSINNNLSSGYIFSINDISGLPSFRVNADGTVGIAEFFGNVGIGITNPAYKFQVRGDSYFASTGNTALLLLSGTGGTIIASNSVNITLTDPARKGLVINAANSQTANIFEWYADGGVGGGYSLAGTIRPSGQVHLGSPGLTMSNGGSAFLGLQGRGSSEGLAIRGYNSNSSNPLFEIQGNPGNQLFGIYGDGGVNAPRINVTNGTASTATNNGALIVTGGVGIGGSVNIGSALTVSGTTRLNSSLFNIPLTSSIIGGTSGSVNFGTYWTGYQVENGYLIYGRQVSGGFINIIEPLTGAQVGGTSNVFAEALKHFKWGKDKYVVLASTGNSVLYSTSPVGAGSSWAFAALPTTASWQKLEYGNNRFVAIATGSTAAYSYDGITWSLSSLPSSIAWSDIKYGNGVFVAGAGSTVAYSYDGIDWAIASNSVAASNLTYGNGFFFANSTGNTASYSADGINWTNVTLPSDTHRGSAYGNGVFFNVGASSSNYISSDLINWTATANGVGSLSVPNSPWYVNNTFYYNQFAGSLGAFVAGPSGTLDLNPRFTGDINNVEIGGIKPAAAEFTTLAASGPVRFVSGLASTNFKNGSVVITGGVGIGGTLNVNNIGIGYTGIPYSPSIAFIGTTGDPIRLNVLSNNTLSFEGRSGQLFSINNNLSSGWIFSVNDISGIPLFRANADATISMAEYAGNVGIGLSNPTFKFQVAGSASIGGTFLISSATASTAASNGALTVSGGVGIGGTLNANTVNVVRDFNHTPNITTIGGASGWVASTASTFITPSTFRYLNNKYIGIGGTYIYYSDDLVNWSSVMVPNLDPARQIADITYGEGKYVFVQYYTSNAGYSTNLTNWTNAALQYNTWSKVVYGNGRFVADSGGSPYAYSLDGTSWVMVNDAKLGYSQSLQFINGYFYSCNSASLSRSIDGANWQACNTTAIPNGLAYGNGLFVGGVYNSGTIVYSYDGLNFSTYSGSSFVHNNANFYNGVYYLTTNNNQVIRYSTDGFNWTNSTGFPASVGNLQYIKGRLYAGSGNTVWVTDATPGRFEVNPLRTGTLDDVEIGRLSPNNANFIDVSVNNNLNVSSQYDSASYLDGALTVAGGVGIGKTVNVQGSVNISNSLNLVNKTTGIATTWTRNVVGTAATISYLAYANNLYVGVGYSSLTSTDGVNWTTRTLPNNLSFVSYGNGIWSGLLFNSALGATSTNGTSWTSYAMTNSRQWTMMAFGNNTFVTLARSTNIAAYSTNGYNWTEVSLPTTGSPGWVWLTYGGGYFVGVANGSATAVYSTDGINWSTTTLPSASGWNCVTYGNGYFYVTGSSLFGVYSKDLINWTSYTHNVTSTAYAAYNNGTFVVVDVNASFTTSIITGDFTSKTQINLPGPQIPTTIVAGDRNFIAGYGQTFYTFPIPNNSITLNPNTTGEINNVEIGSVKPAAGNFSNLYSQNIAAIGSTIRSTSPYNGALTVLGGAGIAGTLNANSVVTYNRLQNQSFSGSSVGSSDGRSLNYGILSGHDRISYGNGVFVTNSSWGAYNSAYSTDGINWTQSSLPVNQGYPVSMYGNGYFVLVATGATNVMYSTNGISWSQVSIGNTFSRTDGVYGNGKYVVVGTGETYNYSTNITSWTSGTLPLTGDWRIAYGNGVFVALGYNSRKIIYSYDGIYWNIANTKVQYALNWTGLKYANGRFIASAYSGGGSAYSLDGINWFSAVGTAGENLEKISYGNGVYFVSSTGSYYTSGDGTTYNNGTPWSVMYEAGSTAYGLGKFQAIGRWIDGPTNTVTIEPKFTGEINNVRIGAITPASGDFTNLSSTGSANLVGTVNAYDLNIISKVNQTPVLGGFAGTTGWTSSGLLSGNSNYALAFGNGLFIQIRRSTDYTSYSPDGKLWVASNMPFSGSWNDVAWGKDKFVAVAGVGTTGAFSGNGITWSSMNMPSTAEGWYAVTYGDDKFVAVGNTSTSAYSSDGITWSGSSIANTNWTGIAYGNGTFVAVSGNGSSSAYSYDGLNWNYSTVGGVNNGVKFITYGNGYFIVTNYVSTAINYSRDGINWSTSTRSSSYNIHTDLAYGNGIYSIFNYQEVSYSYDAINWLNGNTINPTDWQAVAYGNNRFVATSYNTSQVGSIDGPSNTLNLYPKFTGDIDNVRIGAKQPAAAEFTNLAAQQPVRFTANTTSTDSNSGALVVLGGVGIGGTVYQRGSLHSGSMPAPSIYSISGSGLTGSLTPSTVYYYVVTALDFDGRESTASNQVSVNTSTNTSVQIRWYEVPGARQYRVYRSTVSGVYDNTFIRTTKLDDISYFLDYGFNTSTGTPPITSQAYTNKISYNTSNTSTTGNILHGVNIPSGSLSVNSKNDLPQTTVEITGDAAFTRLAPGTNVAASTGGTLTAGTIYYYRHSFVDSRGVESLASEPAPFQAPAGGAIQISWSIENDQYQVARVYRSTNIDSWTNTFISESRSNNFTDINYPQLNSSPVTTSSSHSNTFISNTTNNSIFTNLALSAGRTNLRRVNTVPTITASTSTASGTLLQNTTYYYKAAFFDHLGGISRYGPEIAINTGIGTAINFSFGIGSHQGVYLYRSTTPNFTSGTRFFTTGSFTDDGSLSNSTSVNSDPQNGIGWNLGYAGNLLPFNLNISTPSNGFGLGVLADTPTITFIGNGSGAGFLTTGTKYYYRVVANDAYGQYTSASQISSFVAPANGTIYLAFGSSRLGFSSYDVYRSTDPNNFSNSYIGNYRNNTLTDFGYATSSGSPREGANIAKDIYLRGHNSYNIHSAYIVNAAGFAARSIVPVFNTGFSVGPGSGTLTANTDYYYKIRVHFWANNTIGEISDPIKVNTGSNTAIYLQWQVVPGAQHYTLYRSTDAKNFTNAIIINGIKDNFAYDYGHSVATETPSPNYFGSNDVIGDSYGSRLSSLRIIGDNQFIRSLFDAPKFSTYPSSTTGGTLPNNTVFFYTIVARGYTGNRSLSSSEIRVDTGGNNAISLLWLNVNGATGYDIYRSTTINSWANTLIASDVKSNSFVDLNYPTTTGTPERLNAYNVGVAQSLFENNYNILARTIFGSVNSVDSSYQNFTVRINGNIFRNSTASTLQVGTGFTAGYVFNGSSSGTEIAIASSTGFTGSLLDAHSEGVSRFRISFDGTTSIGSSIASTSTTAGALIVTGGVGIGGSLNIGSDVTINGGRESNSTSTGSLIVRGGAGITGGLYVRPFSLSTKGLVVQANTSQTGNLFELQNSASSTITSFNASGELNITSTTGSTSAAFGSIVTAGGVGIGGSVSIGSAAGSASTTTGALKVVGGVGIGGTLNVGGSVNFSSSIFGGVSTSIVPTMTFIGPANDPITLSVLSDNSLSFDGSSGQLFSINNNLSTGWIFSISDISGLPLFRTNADGTVSMGEFGGNVGIGLTNPTFKLQVVGNAGISGTTVISNTTAATSFTSGALTVAGGAAIGNTLFVKGNAHFGSTSYRDTYDIYNWPIIIATENYPGDSGIQIQNKSNDLNARSGINIYNDFSTDYFNFMLGSSNYAGVGQSYAFIETNKPLDVSFASGMIIKDGVGDALRLSGTAVTIAPNTESTSTTTGSLIVTGGAGIAKSVNIGGFLSSKPAYATAGLATDQTIPSNADQLLLFTDNTDPNNWWTGTAAIGVSHRFKPNIAGAYFVALQVHFKQTTGTGQMNIQARKNANTFSLSISDLTTTTSGNTLNATGVISMDGNTDYLDFTAYSNSSGSQVITGDAGRAWSQVTIYKLF